VHCTNITESRPDLELLRTRRLCHATFYNLFAIYPYAREYISDATRRMGLPALVLDLLKR